MVDEPKKGNLTASFIATVIYGIIAFYLVDKNIATALLIVVINLIFSRHLVTPFWNYSNKKLERSLYDPTEDSPRSMIPILVDYHAGYILEAIILPGIIVVWIAIALQHFLKD